jgi:hypothetical protein
VHIGIDLDNTIVDYADAFLAGAAVLGIAVAGEGKTALRDALRTQPQGELRWTQLQAYVYGPGIDAARLFDGVDRFIAHARARGIPLTIVSHKTTRALADPDGPDLRDCARRFLHAAGIVLPVHFADTRDEKCRLIGTLGITHMIDDLIEVFVEPAFPDGVARWLFAPFGAPHRPEVDRVFTSWDALTDALP